MFEVIKEHCLQMPGLKDEALVAVGNLRAEEKQELGV